MKSSFIITSLIIAMFFAGCSEQHYCPPVKVRPAPVNNTDNRIIALVDALNIADEAAQQELSLEEENWRKDIPNVFLRLIDYEVFVSHSDAEYSFSYYHSNRNIPFQKWFGHPMHFMVTVNKQSGNITIFRGA
jgi:hypothetical protein